VAVKVFKEDHCSEVGLAIGKIVNQVHLLQKERERFQQEAELLGALRHPNIVTCLGFSIGDNMVGSLS
jgi:serine/threonine protein kinase